jgi:DNA polymerase V
VAALRRVYRKGYEYRKAGVMLSGLVPASPSTGRLFTDTQLERFRLVMPAVDKLNKKYGRDTVRLAGRTRRAGGGRRRGSVRSATLPSWRRC